MGEELMTTVCSVISAFTVANFIRRKHPLPTKALQNTQMLISPVQKKIAWKSSHIRKKKRKLGIFWVVQEIRWVNQHDDDQ